MHYVAFVDPSGGSNDAMTLGVAHTAADRVVLDCVRERRPPFSPDAVVADYAGVCRTYGIMQVTSGMPGAFGKPAGDLDPNVASRIFPSSGPVRSSGEAIRR